MTDNQKQTLRGMQRAGLSYSEIAVAADIPLNTVKSFFRRENIRNHHKESAPNRCKNCDGPLGQRTGTRQKIFCSDKCRSDWWNRNREWAGRKTALRLRCQCCGAEFESYGNKNRKYCGRECYIRSRYGEGLP